MAVHPAPSSNSHLTGNGPVSMHTTEDIDMMPSKGQHTYPSPAGFSLRFRWHRKKLNPAKWALSRVSFLLPCSTQSWPKENHSSKAGHYYYCRTNAIVSFLSFHGFIRDQRRPIFEGVTTFFSCTQWSQNWARREKKVFSRDVYVLNGGNVGSLSMHHMQIQNGCSYGQEKGERRKIVAPNIPSLYVS